MTPSSPVANPSDDALLSKKAPEYKYDVKLEVGAAEGSGPIPIVAIFLDLVKRMKEVVDEGKVLVVLTANDQLFSERAEVSSNDFQKAFKVDQIDGKNSKVMMGFKLRTGTTLYESSKGS